MQILGVSNYQFFNPLKNKTQQNNNRINNFGLTMSQPLSCDMVTFSATPKNLENRAYGVSLDTARRVYKEAEPMQKKVTDFMQNVFGDLIATDMNPHNLIYCIKSRTKSPVSIMEKSSTRQLNSKSEILTFMTDLNGAKIVMREGRRNYVDNVVERLLEPIQSGEVELVEIENKRPSIVKGMKGAAKKEQYDYASIKMLSSLVDAEENKWLDKNGKKKHFVKFDTDDYTDLNYCAVHFLLKFPEEERPFELMLMGYDVSLLKDLDDKLFKILNNKNAGKEYKPLVKIVKPLLELGNAPLLEKFNKYRAEAFLFQREKEPKAMIVKNSPVYLLPMRYDLPPELDLNNLYKIYTQCREAEIKNSVKK